ncbi:MAG: 3-deoxy-D-manno-octulosonic acid transferase [Halothermotrichaceae bacterium]
MYFIYDVIFILLFIIYLPAFIFKLLKGKYREGFWQRFGFIPTEKLRKLTGKPVIWVHSVSVGETVAASSVVKELKQRYPEYAILFSTVTDTGQRMARKIINEADVYIYFPLDFSPVLKRVLNKIKPELVVIMESELWPNFVCVSDKIGASVILVNGRISDNSAKKYKYLGPYLSDMIKRIALFCMQSEQDSKYIIGLGADSEKVYNTGNTKLDQDYSNVNNEEKDYYYKQFKLDKTNSILVVGSTHPDEEEQFIKVFSTLRQIFKDIIMIIAPRHIKRSAEIADCYSKAGIKTVLRTEIEQREDEPVIILNTIGELAKIYSIADLVFIGGSLIEIGGHNILEPAAHGKLVFFGPHMFNFKESTRLLMEQDAAIQVEDLDELIDRLKEFLANPELIREYSEHIKKVIKNNKGASRRTVDLLAEVLRRD